MLCKLKQNVMSLGHAVMDDSVMEVAQMTEEHVVTDGNCLLSTWVLRRQRHELQRG